MVTTLLLAVAAPTAFADSWKLRAGACNANALSDSASVPLATLQKCVRLFEAYRAVEKLTPAQRTHAVEAMKRLYKEGTEVDAHIARQGLRRLGINAPRRGASEGDSGAQTPPTRTTRKKCAYPAPTKQAKKQADLVFRKGMAAYRKKKYDAALGHFETMMQKAPGYAKSLRNAAGLNALTDHLDRSLELLGCLKDLGTPAHLRALKKTRWDKDFSSLRDSAMFKQVTGYARIALVDTLKAGRGLDNLDNLEELIGKIHFKVHTRKEAESKEQTHPTIFYQNHSRVPAFLISKLVDHPGLKIVGMPAKYVAKNFDIIVLWGDRYKKGEDPKMRVPDPDDANNLLDDIARKEDEIMRSPDEYERKLDEALGAPDKAINKVERIGDKAEKVINKPGEALDKIEKLGNKLSNPW